MVKQAVVLIIWAQSLWLAQATAVTLLLNLRSPAKCWAFLYAGVAPKVNEQALPHAALGVEKAVVNLSPLRFNRAKGGSHDSITDSGFALCQLQCGGSDASPKRLCGRHAS